MSSTIAFLGCGAMSEAIMAGLLGSGFPADQVRASVRTTARAAWLADTYGVTATATEGTAGTDANARAATGAGLVVLGVKPGLVREVAAEIAPHLDPAAVVVSVAGAVPLASIESALPESQPVVRAMPNTPARVGYGVTALAGGTAALPSHVEAVRDLFATVGLVVEVPEERIDAVGTISGSGPAYVFYLAEAMAEAGVRLGLPAELARTLAAHTVAGAGRLLDDPDADPAALRRAVSSPNGSTERAIAAFEERGLRAVVAAGAAAAEARAKEITRELA